MNDNEIHLRRVFRIYRNAFVNLVRDRLTLKYGADAESKLATLFGKVDKVTGKTQWDRMQENAKQARLAPEISTSVTDCFEVLGISDAYTICEKFYDDLVPNNPKIKQDDSGELKKGLLRCIRQIKLFRDPNSHEVTEAIDDDSLLLCLANSIAVVRFFELNLALTGLQQLRDEIFRRRTSRSAAVFSLGSDSSLMEIVTEKMRAFEVDVSRHDGYPENCDAALSYMARGRKNVVLCLGMAPGASELGADEKSFLSRMLIHAKRNDANLQLIVPRDVNEKAIPLLFEEEVRGLLAGPNTPIIFFPEYSAQAVERLCQRLRPEYISFSSQESTKPVAVASAIHDERLATKVFTLLMNPEVSEIRIVSPFLSDLSPASFGENRLSSLLIRAKQRGCAVTLITRPPIKPGPEETRKLALLDVLHREDIPIFLNESLHSKAYLFKLGEERQVWVVGSHNLTDFAFSKSLETSMLGYRAPEYNEASTAFGRARNHRNTINFDVWKAQNMRSNGTTNLEMKK